VDELITPSIAVEPTLFGNFAAKHWCDRTVCRPDWIIGTPPQVRRTNFWKDAIETAALQVIEYFAVFDCVEIKTEHRHSTIEKIEPSIIGCIAVH